MLFADKVHYVNGPGEVLHAFDAEAAEELSVYAGEEASPFLRLKSAQQGCTSQTAHKMPCRGGTDKTPYSADLHSVHTLR